MKQYKKYYIIPAEPEILYPALTNEYTIQLWTGDEAEMSTEIGSEFSYCIPIFLMKILKIFVRVGMMRILGT
jgi:hypothetical protein